ncbi:esterase/lipase family protein [Wenzhouxiangella marina]|uniref:Lipase n=1 Tax=Wenzhouxiangella marina TaxID=1579979 RepID=A0A0K0XT96_9GAMM|nr:alpha/beta fold hydrolase [Wenzhouxiangella marina]AKS40841.1 Lipase [Wenzhouxiangella marina]MBB6087715.1 pimeloyl-ACP methyl ester carboxylesterase [Wenzhouxiangella marina]
MQRFPIALASLILLIASAPLLACQDAVVLVHGNTGSPSDWNNTYSELRARGVPAGAIFRPAWGSACAACNDHNGSEEWPVVNALADALTASCTGRIDVIGHSMGATLAAKQIADYGIDGYVDTFVGIAGAFRGLWSCGRYPWNVWNSTCGYWGLSVNSPFLNALDGEPLGRRVYSIKSWIDQVVCATGTCTVGGIHSSQISGETASYSVSTGHFGLQQNTAPLQADLID